MGSMLPKPELQSKELGLLGKLHHNTLGPLGLEEVQAFQSHSTSTDGKREAQTRAPQTGFTAGSRCSRHWELMGYSRIPAELGEAPTNGKYPFIGFSTFSDYGLAMQKGLFMQRL